jgi:hypothetical protein
MVSLTIRQRLTLAMPMFDHDPQVSHIAIMGLLLGCELAAFRFLERSDMLHIRQAVAKKAHVIDECAIV